MNQSVISLYVLLAIETLSSEGIADAALSKGASWTFMSEYACEVHISSSAWLHDVACPLKVEALLISDSLHFLLILSPARAPPNLTPCLPCSIIPAADVPYLTVMLPNCPPPPPSPPAPSPWVICVPYSPFSLSINTARLTVCPAPWPRKLNDFACATPST